MPILDIPDQTGYEDWGPPLSRTISLGMTIPEVTESGTTHSIRHDSGEDTTYAFDKHNLAYQPLWVQMYKDDFIGTDDCIVITDCLKDPMLGKFFTSPFRATDDEVWTAKRVRSRKYDDETLTEETTFRLRHAPLGK